MKILQVNSVCGVGSTGRITTDLYKIIEENGHECVIAYGRGDAPKGIKSIKIGSTIDNYMHVFKTRIFDGHGFGSKSASLDFVKKVEEYNPDIIHLHNIHGYYINIEVLFDYIKKNDKNVIWTLHDCWAFTGHCSYFDIVNCYKWKNVCYQCPNKLQYPKSLIFDNSKQNYINKKSIFTGVNNLTIITPSFWLSALTKQSFLKDYESKIIYHGIDLNNFSAKKNDSFRDDFGIDDKFVILGVANIWDERKGYKYFLQLSRIIKEDTIIVMVGLNDKQLSKLPPNIIGIKRTKSIEELAEIYSAADVFFNPTLEEMFGLVNIEALACGTPVVTFNSGGSPECINENTGYIIDKGDLDEAVLAFEKIKEKAISAKTCRERAQLFNKDDKYLEYIKLYERINK